MLMTLNDISIDVYIFLEIKAFSSTMRHMLRATLDFTFDKNNKSMIDKLLSKKILLIIIDR